ncbi:MAG: D-alanyl-D-alanine carboxypeptidase, partial [Cyanobacteria bacterium P01_D01_bin.6]
MVDGSGLARKNLVTPEAMVDVLQVMARSPYATTYRNSLAVAGVSGTLRNRLRDTPAAGRLYGKSGAISRNFALAGYLEPPNYAPLAFNIVINNINARGSIARPMIDEVVLQLADLEVCN